MPTMTQVFKVARTLRPRDRAKLISKLIVADMPAVDLDDAELARREEDVRLGRVPYIDAADVMREARVIAGIGGEPLTRK